MARGTQILSIFGQCERVAADMLAKKYKLHKIAPQDFPATVEQTSVDGTPVSFAIVIPNRHMGEFISLVLELRE